MSDVFAQRSEIAKQRQAEEAAAVAAAAPTLPTSADLVDVEQELAAASLCDSTTIEADPALLGGMLGATSSYQSVCLHI